MSKKYFTFPRNPIRLLAILSIAPIVCLSLYFFLVSLNHIIGFNGSAANGAFQLMNPLTRLAEGQVIGRDFPFFHGVGVVLIHYPIFTLFGEGLFGSEMSRWFTSVVLFIASGFLFFYIWYYKQKDGIWLGLMAFAVSFALAAVFAEVITPSNSLLGIRTIVPILIALLVLNRQFLYKKLFLFRDFGVNIFKLFMGFALALAVLMGTEHGIAATIAYLLIEFAISVSIQTSTKHKMRRLWSTLVIWTKESAPTLVYAFVSILVLTSIISHGHPLKLLKYSLITVPDNQFWYFGAEPQGYLRLDTLFSQLSHSSLYLLYIGILVTAFLIWTAAKLHILTRREWYAIAFIVSYGFLTLGSLLGYFTPPAQIPGILRALIITDVIIFIQLIQYSAQSQRIKAHLAITVTLSLLFLAVAGIYLYQSSQFTIRPLLRGAYNSVKGGQTDILSATWGARVNQFQPYIIDAKRVSPQYPIWSTYASLYENRNHIIHPSSDGCDYIIHCLGETMQNNYTQDFINTQPELVTTLRPSYFGFEEWLWGRHASFYEHLTQNYSIVADNDAHILWKRTKKPSQQTRVHSLSPSNDTIKLPARDEAGTRLIKITVTYRTDEKYKKIPLINKMPRYMVRPYGTTSTIGFSLPPNQKTWSFLVVLGTDQEVDAYLGYRAEGLLPSGHFDIISATYKPIYVDNKTEAYFAEKSAFIR